MAIAAKTHITTTFGGFDQPLISLEDFQALWDSALESQDSGGVVEFASAPGVTNDINDSVNAPNGVGFSNGFRWIDTSTSPKETYILADNADGAAIWFNTSLEVGDLGTMAIVDSPAPIANGGTGSTTQGGARTNLGLAIGTDVQAFGAVLDDFNTLGAATADGEFIVATAAGVFAYESGATVRTSLGLAIGVNVQAFNANTAIGPGSSTNRAIARYSGTGGTLLLDSSVTISDGTGNMAGVGTILAANGTGLLPTYSFNGDPDTGMFTSFTNTIDFACGGVNRVEIQVNGDLLMLTAGAKINAQCGTLSTLGYCFRNDVDTGFFSPGANMLAVVCGGVEQMRYNVTGNHIMTSLLNEGAGNETAFAINYEVDKATSGNDAGLVINKTDTASPGTSLLLDLQVGGSPQFSIDDTGAVTVGVWNGTDIAIADGGTGSSTDSGARTNLGVEIGSDVQAFGAVLDDFNTLGAATTDGEFIVATAAGVFAYESGATVRTSLGLTIGTNVQAFGAVLDDFNTLGAATTDGEFIVATAAGVFAYESGATARTSLGVSIGSDVQAFGAVLDDFNTLGAPTADGEVIVATAAGVFAYETGDTLRTSLGLAIGTDVQAFIAPTTFRADQSSTSVSLNATFATITGCSLTLTLPAGESTATYHVIYSARGQVNAPGKFVTYRLFDVTGAAAIVETEGISGNDDAGTFTNSQNTAWMDAYVTVTASKTVRLEGKGSVATGCSSTSDSDGRTIISAHRI